MLVSPGQFCGPISGFLSVAEPELKPPFLGRCRSRADFFIRRSREPELTFFLQLIFYESKKESLILIQYYVLYELSYFYKVKYDPKHNVTVQSVLWIRICIQELLGSGSIFGIRIRIHTCKYRIKWRQKMSDLRY